jgi:hypothetical protein
MARKIKKIRVEFVSLVPMGANNLRVVYKEDGRVELPLLTKGMTDEGELAALVYVPGVEDLQGDMADAQVVKEMAHTFLESGGKLDLQHNFKPIPRDKAFVAESFLIRGHDPRFSGLSTYEGHPVDPIDGWAIVIKIQDPELRRLYREGGWNGVSLGGKAQFEEVDEKKSFWASVKALFSRKEEDMEPKELKSLLEGLAKGQETLTKSLEVLSASLKAQGDAQKAQADALAKLDKEFAAKKAAEEEAAKKAAEAAKDAEIAKLKAEKAELEKKAGVSNQDTLDAEKDIKSVEAAVARAAKVGELWNKREVK